VSCWQGPAHHRLSMDDLSKSDTITRWVERIERESDVCYSEFIIFSLSFFFSFMCLLCSRFSQNQLVTAHIIQSLQGLSEKDLGLIAENIAAIKKRIEI
jgi:hypothetical protein